MRKFQILLMVLVGLCCSSQIFAQYIDDEGVTYRVISEEEQTAMVYRTHRCWTNYQVPSRVNYDGKSYAVVAVDFDAFSYLNCLLKLDLFQVNKINDGYVEIYEDGAKRYHGAFSNCGALEQIDFGEVRSLGDYSFCACFSLTDLNLSNVETVGEECFASCEGLKFVHLGSKIQQIAKAAFQNIASIEKIEVLNSRPPRCADDAFSEIVYQNAVLKVPSGTKTAYEKADGWKKFKHIKEMQSTGLEEVMAPTVLIKNGYLYIEGAPIGETVRVYDLKGCLLCNFEVSRNTENVKLAVEDMSRVLIVNFGNKTFRVSR